MTTDSKLTKFKIYNISFKITTKRKSMRSTVLHLNVIKLDVYPK